MKMRALVISDDERRAIQAAVKRAYAKPLSLAQVERGAATVPQDKATLTLADRTGSFEPHGEGVILPGGYRAAISFEYQPIGLCRHLSVSVDTPGRVPHMLAVGMIAEAFGFVQGMEREIWTEEFDPGEYAVNVVEPVLPPSTETKQ